MDKISTSDLIFDYDCKHTCVFSYYGWEFNNCHAFYNYMTGYKASADATFEAFIKAALSGNNEVSDTICYPLVYLYRHMTELMLKYSFIELKSNRTNEEIESFLRKGHNLIDLWNNVKPDFERLSSRTGVVIDILAINHYITELSNIDDSSMAYRYPIRKNLDRFHNKDLRLNIPHLKERMDAFYNYMLDKITVISQHMEDDEYNPKFDEQFTSDLYKSLDKIRVALDRIKNNIEQSHKKGNDMWDSLDELYNGNVDDHDWIDSFFEHEKSVLLLLYYTGRQIPMNTLAINPVERRKDVMKLVYGNAHDEFLLDSPKSCTKDDCFKIHIAYGESLSKKYIELTLSELGIKL